VVVGTDGERDGQALVALLRAAFKNGETTRAVEGLLAAQRPEQACSLLADVAYRQLDQIDVDEMAALLSAVPDAIIALHPRCLIKLARAAEGRVRIELRTRLLQRLSTIIVTIDNPMIARELESEFVMDLNRDSLVEETERRGRALLAETPLHELAARSRCLHALGRITAWRGDDRSLVEASHLLAEAVGAMRAIGDDVGVADALCTLGWFVALPRGDFEVAITRQREGLALLPPGTRRRAVQLTFLAESLALLGRDDEAIEALTESRSIGRAHADERILGYAAWTQAKVVARRRDVQGTLRWLREAERHPGDWFDHPTGTQFLAEAAEIAAEVGADQVAEEYLTRSIAQATAQGWPEIPEAATGALAARFGDAVLAEHLLTLDRLDAYRNASNRWRASLLIAHAQSRRGNLEAASAGASAVIDELETLGHPELAMLHEPELWTSLVRLVDREARPALTIAVLGGFRVEVDGIEVQIPAGRPARVVKILAVAGSAMPVDELVELLWPDTAGDVGRRRLRNVLARVRAAAPVLGRSDGVISLAAGAVVDLHEFEQFIARAGNAAAEEQVRNAEVALMRFAGELLPADRFDEWMAAPRERIRRRTIRLLSIVIDAAVASNDIDRAAQATEQLLVLDPFDFAAVLRTALLLYRNGRQGEAVEWATRFSTIRRDLGLTADDDPLSTLRMTS